jgi:outer membrane immunogenic protein
VTRGHQLKKILLATAAAATLLSVPAFAADMAVKAPMMTPAPAFDWSGFYIGGDAGWQGSRIGLSSPAPGASLTYAATHDSFIGGGFAGAQKQFGQFVLGIEGGYLAATGNQSLGSTPTTSIFFPGGTGTGQVKLKDIWSVGGRLGLGMGMWMPYLTGGYSSGAFEFDAQDALSERASSRNGGGYIGVGVDYALTHNWILGAEYRHYALDSKTVTAVRTDGFTEPVTIAPRTDTVVARLSYKFDWAMH